MGPGIIEDDNSVIRDDLIFGSDDLIGGKGDDKLYGDWGNVDITLASGHTFFTEPIDGSEDYVNAAINYIEYGADTVDGGRGHDQLYGEGEIFALEAQGGTIAASGDGSLIEASTEIKNMVMGSDELNGGHGDDELYGDWDKMKITLVNGQGSDTPQGDEFTDSRITSMKFGDDTIDGGEGHDFIVGDVADVWHFHTDFGGTDLGNSFVEDIDVTWGNDILTGGWGDDTFFFEIQDNGGDMQMQGDDIITDIEAWDTLEFADVLDVNGGGVDLSDLDDQTTFTDDGTDVRIDFAGGGSLTLEGAGTGSISDFTDLEAETSAQVVV